MQEEEGRRLCRGGWEIIIYANVIAADWSPQQLLLVGFGGFRMAEQPEEQKLRLSCLVILEKLDTAWLGPA